MSDTNVIRATYAALNRNDISAMVSAFDPQIEWIDPVENPLDGTYRGLEAVKAHIVKARGTWAEGSCEPERFVVAGDKIIVFIHVRVRLKISTDWIDAHTADVYTFRDGKVLQVRSFADSRRALEWAGVESSGAT